MGEQSELLTATDEMIDDAVKHADPMVLRGLLYQLTGDESIEPLRPPRRMPEILRPRAPRRTSLWCNPSPTSLTRRTLR